jgi:hypothetical protein
MTNVYAWPPVGYVESEWTVVDPISVSESLITGAVRESAASRSRRHVTLTVTGLGNTGSNAGYMEMLKRFLAGGIHRIRLDSFPITHHLDRIGLFDGYTLTGTPGTGGGYDTLVLTGCPPDVIVARPGDLVSVGASQAVVVREASSNGAGNATLRLMSAIAAPGTAVIGTTESAVFRAVELPRAVQPVVGDWSYTWKLIEVFEDEHATAFVEIDPW